MYYTVSVFKLKIINSKYNENVSFSWHWLGSVATMDSIVLGEMFFPLESPPTLKLRYFSDIAFITALIYFNF